MFQNMQGPAHQMHGFRDSHRDPNCPESLDWGWWGPAAYLFFPGLIPQKDLLLFGDGILPVVVHQLVEGWKLLCPQEVITLVVSHDFEVLNIILMPKEQDKSKLCIMWWACLCLQGRLLRGMLKFSLGRKRRYGWLAHPWAGGLA